MHILITLTYYRPHYSGLTIYAERLARALVQRGHRVTVLTSRYDSTLPFKETCDGVEIIRPQVGAHISKGVLMPSMPYWAWKLIRQADVVQLHLPQLDAAYMAIFGRLLNKPVVVTYHCDLILPKGLVHSIANQISNMANTITIGVSNVIVHNTQDYAEHSSFLKKHLHKVQAILPPIETSLTTPEDINAFQARLSFTSNELLIGMVARLATEKGVEYLAQAMPMVIEEIPQAKVLFVGPYQNVVGEEAYAKHLAPLIESLGSHWCFLGVLPPGQHAAFFKACNVTVLPSINNTESYGLVQVESMAEGTPVVVSNRPGMRIPVQITGMGKIVEPQNPQALAQAIIAILKQPELFKGNPADLLRASQPQVVAESYEKLFNHLLQRST